jgi:hypothetical protein
MKKSIQISEVPDYVKELITYINKGNEVLFMEKNEAVAKLTSVPPKERHQFSKKDTKEKWTSDDFDLSFDS